MMMACLDKMCHIILPSCSGLKRQKEAKPDTYTKKKLLFFFLTKMERAVFISEIHDIDLGPSYILIPFFCRSPSRVVKSLGTSNVICNLMP